MNQFQDFGGDPFTGAWLPQMLPNFLQSVYHCLPNTIIVDQRFRLCEPGAPELHDAGLIL